MAGLRAKQDGYGQGLYKHYLGKQLQEIVERSDGLVNLSPGPAAYFSEYKNWPDRQKQAMRFARGRVLDIGCGAGRHALYLQGKGLDVLGVDVSPLAIKVCRLRGLKKTRVASITDISPRWGTFDTVTMLGNNFGLFGSLRRARQLLKRLHRMTSPDARIIAETLDPYQTKEPVHLRYHKWNRAHGRMPGQARIRVRYLEHASPWFDYLLVSRDEMKMILHGTGWHIARIINSEGPSFIAVIKKERPS